MQSGATFVQDNIVLFIVLAILVAATVGYELQRLTRKYKEVLPAQAVALINRETPMLLDVREASELAQGGIRNARHIAAGVLEKRLSELEKFKDKPVIAYCASGARSPAACRILSKHGFPQVYNLKGGLSAWEQAGMPVEKR